MESIYVRCDRCGKDITNESVWHYSEYGRHAFKENSGVVHCFDLCSDCVKDLGRFIDGEERDSICG